MLNNDAAIFLENDTNLFLFCFLVFSVGGLV